MLFLLRICKSQRSAALLIVIGGIVLLLSAGCRSAAQRVVQVDGAASNLLNAVQQQQQPEQLPEEINLDLYSIEAAAELPSPLHLNLRTALATAAVHSREYQAARERLFESALTLYQQSHRWQWLPSGQLSSNWSQTFADSDSANLSLGSRLGINRRFAYGGRLASSLAIDTLRYISGDRSVNASSLLNLSFTQPLLAGFGQLPGQESLTQAERSLGYALRNYIRQRRSLMLQVVDSYFAAISSKDALAIAERNLQRLQDARDRSQAMAEAGRLPAFQLDQAEQDLLRAQSQVLNSKENVKTREDELKRMLGVPTTNDIILPLNDLQRLAELDAPVVADSVNDLIARALVQRLDLATARDQVEDAERAAAIALDALRPALDLTVASSMRSPGDRRLRWLQWNSGRYSAGLTAELPLDKTDQAIAYRRSLINHQVQRRAVAALSDQVRVQVRQAWRSFETAAADYQIQQVSVELARRRVESTELLFRAGRVHVRDVLEAQTALSQAENALTQTLINHRLAWLRLLRDTDELVVDPQTLWSPVLASLEP